MSRSVVVLIIVVLIAGGVTLLFRQPAPVEESALSASKITLTGHHADGTSAWSIRAQGGSLIDDGGELEIVELAFFENSTPRFIVRGDRLVRTSTGSTLAGAVQIEQATTMNLSTESIFWDERNSTLESGPAKIVMDRIDLEAGAFHHNLNTDITTLTRGIAARLTQDGVPYTVTSDSADATSQRLALYGDVIIESDEGSDHYDCQRLESDASGTSVRLTGDVTGVWNQSAFSASDVELDATGIRFRGDVVIDLQAHQVDDSHDA